MINTILALYLQCVSVIGLFDFRSVYAIRASIVSNPYFGCYHCGSEEVESLLERTRGEGITVNCRCWECSRKWKIRIPIVLEK